MLLGFPVNAAIFNAYGLFGRQFKTLGRQGEFQDIEAKNAASLFQDALALCDDYGVSSERAAALMFAIKVQNGGIKAG